MTIPFDRNFTAPYGEAVMVSPLIRRVLAPNPSPFTFRGTGVYIVGRGRVAVIDPGPDMPEHLTALRAALKGENVSHILVTHTHLDHSPAARALKAWTGAKTYGFGPQSGGEAEEGIQIEEGGDADFTPDVRVRDGDVLKGDGFAIACVHTPGHTSNHMWYALHEEKALFTGDHVMGWSTSVIGPPDGDMDAYLASLRKLQARDDVIYWPTHGGPVRAPKPFVAAYIAHRLEREQQILACLKDGIGRIPGMVARLYANVDYGLHPAAALTVLAHLIQMTKEGRVTTDGAPSLRGTFRLCG